MRVIQCCKGSISLLLLWSDILQDPVLHSCKIQAIAPPGERKPSGPANIPFRTAEGLWGGSPGTLKPWQRCLSTRGGVGDTGWVHSWASLSLQPIPLQERDHEEGPPLRKGKTSAPISEEESWPRTALLRIWNHILIKVGTRSPQTFRLPLSLSFSPSLFSSLFWSHIPIFWNFATAKPHSKHTSSGVAPADVVSCSRVVLCSLWASCHCCRAVQAEFTSWSQWAESIPHSLQHPPASLAVHRDTSLQFQGLALQPQARAGQGHPVAIKPPELWAEVGVWRFPYTPRQHTQPWDRQGAENGRRVTGSQQTPSTDTERPLTAPRRQHQHFAEHGQRFRWQRWLEVAE